MSKRSRTKGHNWERRLAQIFRDHGWKARRGIQYRDGSEAPDVIVDDLPYHFEAKIGAQPSHRKAYGQAKKAAEGTGLIPAAVVRDSGTPKDEALVTLSLEDFIDREQEIRERLKKEEFAAVQKIQTAREGVGRGS